MTPTPPTEVAAVNTDREVWSAGYDYRDERVHITEGNGIRISVGGIAVVKTAAEWHRAALAVQVAPAAQRSMSHPWGEPNDDDGGTYDAAESVEALRLLSHRMDDAAQGITESQVYEFATELRVLLGIDGAEAARAAAATSLEPADHFSEALRMSWEGADPLHPPGQPGSYARGQWQGYIDGLQTLRANFNLLSDRAALAAARMMSMDKAGLERMAEEAGATYVLIGLADPVDGGLYFLDEGSDRQEYPSLLRFAALIRTAAMEEAAVICESRNKLMETFDCAAAIRAAALKEQT